MKNFIITNNGKELQAKLVEGSTSARFTKISTSGCDYGDYQEKELESLVKLEDIRQTAPISSITRLEANIVTVVATIENSGLMDGYYVRALGLYAEDSGGSEILFAVSITDEYPDYMSPFSGGVVSAVTYTMNIKVDNAEQVNIEVNPAGAPTIKEVEGIVSGQIDAHAGHMVCSEMGIHGLRYKDGKFSVQDEEGNWEKVPGSGQIIDSVTGEVYTIGVSNGALTVMGAGQSGENQNANKIETSSAVSGVLQAGETELTLSDECIRTDSTIDIYTDCYGVNPKTVVAGDGSVAMTFKAQANDITVKVVVK